MTKDFTHRRTLLEQRLDTDLLLGIIGFTAQRLMELAVQALTGAVHGERSPDRRWDTRAGTAEPRIP